MLLLDLSNDTTTVLHDTWSILLKYITDFIITTYMLPHERKTRTQVTGQRNLLLFGKQGIDGVHVLFQYLPLSHNVKET